MISTMQNYGKGKTMETKNSKLPEVDGRLMCEAQRIHRAVKIICVIL